MVWMQGIGTKIGCEFEHKKIHWMFGLHTAPKPEPPKKRVYLGSITLTDGTKGTVIELHSDERNPGLTYHALRHRLKRGIRDPERLYAPPHSGVKM